MLQFNIYRVPDSVIVQTENEWIHLQHNGEEWSDRRIQVNTNIVGSLLNVFLYSPNCAIQRIRVRWQEKVDNDISILNDHWERGYGDLGWKGMMPERVLPWYFMANNGNVTDGYGVKTNPKAMCFWQVDNSGVSLWMDVRCGGMGVVLGERTLPVASIVTRAGKENESSFQATRAFCKMMCDNGLVPPRSIVGGNNWYYAFGDCSEKSILEDSKLISSLSDIKHTRPYMIVDDGWQLLHIESYSSGVEGYNGGPWNASNYRFPDMGTLALKMEEIGVTPGIWFRPLLTQAKVPEAYYLKNKREGISTGKLLDPSRVEVLDLIGDYIRCLKAWGYKLIKHDFTTYDIFGRWGSQMGANITNSGWTFADRSKTTAEIKTDLYKAIKMAAGDTLVIGCNTIGHLGTGYFDIQRTGDDTNGRIWETTRKMGVNTLAFRMPQHGSFFAADADCVGVTRYIPWELNKKWLDLLSQSGTSFFVSVDPSEVTKQQKIDIKKAFEVASKGLPTAEPLDWMNTTCPQKWLINGKETTFDWFDSNGIWFFNNIV